MKWLTVFLVVATAVCAQTKVPGLAQLKVAAEGGDAVAQFEYGSTIWASNPKESIAMKLKSADQGYGPAEDAVGEYYASQAQLAQDGDKMQRLAVRYTSRAAFKRIHESQHRLSRFYGRGDGVSQSPMLAYGWLAIAQKTASDLGQASLYASELDQLIAVTPSEAIVAGQKFADAFQPGDRGLNAVEADVMFAQLKITGFFTVSGKSGVLVNQIRFSEGETRAVTIDAAPVNLTCVAILGKTARMRIGTYDYTLRAR